MSEQNNCAPLYCTHCGHQNDSNAFKCTACNEVLKRTQSAPTNHSNNEQSIQKIIPYKNPHGLWAYYLSLGSILPFVGILFSFMGIILGIMGHNRATQRPELRGKYHAWAGIVIGLLGLTVQLLVILVNEYLVHIYGRIY